MKKRFTVIWHPDAEQELARIWITSGDRKQITWALATVESKLAGNPETQGESIREGLRRLDAMPICVLFCVRDDDRVVEVLTVTVK